MSDAAATDTRPIAAGRSSGDDGSTPMDAVRAARQAVKREERARLQGILAELEKENGEARTQVKLKSVRLQDAKQRLIEQQRSLDQATACLGTLGL